MTQIQIKVTSKIAFFIRCNQFVLRLLVKPCTIIFNGSNLLKLEKRIEFESLCVSNCSYVGLSLVYNIYSVFIC